MKKELLIALMSSLIDEAISEHDSKTNSSRPKRGPRGFSGKDFSFEENEGHINNLVSSKIDSIKDDLKLKFSDLSEDEMFSIKGDQGPRGLPGRDGSNFSLEENSEYISNEIKEFISSIKSELKLKLEDLTEEEKLSIRGPRGQKGSKGKSFNFEENRNEIFSDIKDLFNSEKEDLKLKLSDLTKEEINSLKLKLDDLTSEDISLIRGPRGFSGKNGKNFDPDESIELVTGLIKDIHNDKKEELKLKFSDLTDDEKYSLQGPKGIPGRSGRDGKSFDFEESKNEIVTILDSLYNEKKDSLKLKFSDLSEDEKDSLKLKFENLTDENLEKIKGSRGQRGKQGKPGISGDNGKDGKDGISIMGPPGLPGIDGRNGNNGTNGLDGQDAPKIISVEAEQIKKDVFVLVFHFDDGSKLETGNIELPSIEIIYTNFMAGGGSAGSQLNIQKDGSDLGVVENLNLVGDNINVVVDDNTKTADISVDKNCLEVYDESNLVTACAKSIDFVGEGVEVISGTKVSDWTTLSDVDSIGNWVAPDAENVTVQILSPSKFSLTKIASEDISKFDLIRLDTQTTAQIAGIDTYTDAVVAGMALGAALTGSSFEFITFGIVEDISFNFPINDPLFLDVDGTITNIPTSTTGKFLTKIGKSYGAGAIFINISDPRGIV